MPGSGAAPGCPFAEGWLALLLYPLLVRLRCPSPGVVPRTYADDLLVTTDTDQPHAAALREAWGLVLDFRTRMRWRLAIPTCFACSTDPAAEASLRDMTGPEVVVSFCDLGIQQTAGDDGGPANLDQRVQAALGRWGRIKTLAVIF